MLIWPFGFFLTKYSVIGHYYDYYYYYYYYYGAMVRDFSMGTVELLLGYDGHGYRPSLTVRAALSLSLTLAAPRERERERERVRRALPRS